MRFVLWTRTEVATSLEVSGYGVCSYFRDCSFQGCLLFLYRRDDMSWTPRLAYTKTSEFGLVRFGYDQVLYP